MILAAGFGTRLRPLTDYLPKAIVPIANKPLLDYHLRSLASIGVKEVMINLHHLPELVKKTIRDSSTYGTQVFYSIEVPEILGTGGGLAQVRDFFKREESFIVINADIFNNINLRSVLEHHEKLKPLATLVVGPSSGAAKMKVVGVDSEGRIKHVPGMKANDSLRNIPFAGIQILTPQVFDYLPIGVFSCLIRTGYRGIIEANLPLSCFHDTNSMWKDTGTLVTYLEANLHALSNREPFFTYPESSIKGRLHKPFLIGRDVVIDTESEIGPYAIIGDGVRVGANSIVRFSVIWPETQVPPETKLEYGVAFDNHFLSALQSD